LRHLEAALFATPGAAPELFARLRQLAAAAADLGTRLTGDEVRGRLNEPAVPSIAERVGQVVGGLLGTRQPPTRTQRRSLEIARDAFAELTSELRALLEDDLPAFEAELEAAGAPPTPGRALPPRAGDG
ncbi:MAG: glycosyl hydrolase, partial [Acidobacteria bacterium]